MIITRRFCHETRKKQRFPFVNTRLGQLLLIGLAFSAQVVSAWRITPAQRGKETVQTIQEESTSKSKSWRVQGPRKTGRKDWRTHKRGCQRRPGGSSNSCSKTEDPSAPVVLKMPSHLHCRERKSCSNWSSCGNSHFRKKKTATPAVTTPNTERAAQEWKLAKRKWSQSTLDAAVLFSRSTQRNHWQSQTLRATRIFI